MIAAEPSSLSIICLLLLYDNCSCSHAYLLAASQAQQLHHLVRCFFYRAPLPIFVRLYDEGAKGVPATYLTEVCLSDRARCKTEYRTGYMQKGILSDKGR